MSHNPFEPHTLGRADVDDGDGLDRLKKPALEKLAQDAGLPAGGTKADLIGRLREHRPA